MQYAYGWILAEGATIPDPIVEYGGSFVNIPSTSKIFFGTPAIQINNPIMGSIIGCAYELLPLSSLGYTTMQQIDANMPAIQSAINSYDKTIDTLNGSIYYYEPFTISESTVIFYDASNAGVFSHYAIIYVDKFASPEIIDMTVKYVGSSIPVGETFDLNDLVVNAIYSNGDYVRIITGYIVDPANKIITNYGSNVIKVEYTSGPSTSGTSPGSTFIRSCVIEGIKNLQAITALYDGPNVPFGHEAKRKYFVVTALYSDGSSETVTSFTFPDGNIVSETNGGSIRVWYHGFDYTVIVPTYSVSTSRLMAFYNGPNVEVGNNFMKDYVKVKIYYTSSTGIDNYYEDINIDDCILSTTYIDHAGLNYITIQYTGKAGLVSTKFIVVGIQEDNQLNFIEAEYTGPEIYKGKTFSLEKIICKAHFSDGQIISVKNFSISSNVVNLVGPNVYTITYKWKTTTVTTTVTVIGLENDSTTESGLNEISLQKNYPEASRQNNRYRGPAESFKHQNVNMMIYENILSLYKIFENIEKSFNKLTEVIQGNDAIKFNTLNQVCNIEDTTDEWIHDERFKTGKYVASEE